MNCSLPGSSVHGIFQARILEWVAIFCSRRSSWPRDWTLISCIGRWILDHCTTWEAFPNLYYLQGYSSFFKYMHTIIMVYFHCFSFTHVSTTFFANDSFFYHRPSQWEHFSSTLSTWFEISHWTSFRFKLSWILSVWMCSYFSPHFWNKDILLNI